MQAVIPIVSRTRARSPSESTQTPAKREGQDRERITRLIDAAVQKCTPATGNGLAAALNVSPQVLSNWKTGQKTPSLEAQCELAAIAGINVAATALYSLAEAAEGQRKERFQSALRDWMKNGTQVVTLVQRWLHGRLGAAYYLAHHASHVQHARSLRG